MTKLKTMMLTMVMALGTAFFLLMRPCLFIVSDEIILLAVPTHDEDEFALRFIHSVQKTPVVEMFTVGAGCTSIELTATKYQSLGVGLPFLEGEGTFSQENGFFIFQNMQRSFSHLPLRTGLGTNLTFIYKGVEYPIYEQVAHGSAIDIKIAPYYTCFY